jgi:hypothetical protein
VKFRAVVELLGDAGNGIAVPVDVIEKLASGDRPNVVIGIGSHSFRTTIICAADQYLIPLATADGDAARVSLGDYITVDIEPDETTAALSRATRHADG